MKFNVTKTDIRKGEDGNGHNCPVARSIRRKLGLRSQDVAVTGLEVEIKGREYVAPQAVDDFVNRFDGHYGVKPFSFVLPIKRRAKRAKKVGARLVKTGAYEYALVS
jgi:hypothetical protein